MHNRLSKQVSDPPLLHRMCAHSICDSEYAQLCDVLLVAVSRKQVALWNNGQIAEASEAI